MTAEAHLGQFMVPVAARDRRGSVEPHGHQAEAATTTATEATGAAASALMRSSYDQSPAGRRPTNVAIVADNVRRSLRAFHSMKSRNGGSSRTDRHSVRCSLILPGYRRCGRRHNAPLAR